MRLGSGNRSVQPSREEVATTMQDACLDMSKWHFVEHMTHSINSWLMDKSRWYIDVTLAANRRCQLCLNLYIWILWSHQIGKPVNQGAQFDIYMRVLQDMIFTYLTLDVVTSVPYFLTRIFGNQEQVSKGWIGLIDDNLTMDLPGHYYSNIIVVQCLSLFLLMFAKIHFALNTLHLYVLQN